MDEEIGLLHKEPQQATTEYFMPREQVVHPGRQQSHRLVNRNGPLFQSSGRIYVKKRIQKADWWALYGNDWFHSLVDAPTLRIVALLFTVYVATVAFFALLYYAIRWSYFCELDFETYLGAFDFSLETMATIGYTTTDLSFSNCFVVTFVLTLQCCMRLMVDGVTIGIIYCRLARPHSRASTIIFSKNAVIRRIRGKLYFMFQLCELRKHQLVEAHVRLYAIRKETDPSGQHSIPYLQTSAMRLNHPNDELGSMLLLMVPQVVVHELDFGSPLMPPPLWIEGETRDTVRWDPPSYRQLKRRSGPTMPETFGSVQSPGPMRNRRPPGNPPSNITPLPNQPSHLPHQQQQQQQQQPQNGYGAMDDSSGVPFPPNIAVTTTQPSATVHPLPLGLPASSSDNLLQFDPEALSAIEFPNVVKRSSDIPGIGAGAMLGGEVYGYDVPVAAAGGDIGLISPSAGVAATGGKGGARGGMVGVGYGVAGAQTTPRKGSTSVRRGSATDNKTPPRDRKRELLPLLHSPPPTSLATNLPYPEDKLESPGMNLYSQGMQQPFLSPSSASQKNNSTSNAATGNSGWENKDAQPAWQVDEKTMIQRFLADRKIEIIAIVEGVDSATGGNVQARQSYTIEEIEWDKCFEYCMFEDPDDGVTTIDFDLFHKLRDVPKDAAYSGAIPSCI